MPDLDFLVSEFQERPLPRLTPRSIALPDIARKPNVVIGMRRTGKTSCSPEMQAARGGHR
jgi:predicted AAA+ superfamily ATPase